MSSQAQCTCADSTQLHKLQCAHALKGLILPHAMIVTLVAVPVLFALAIVAVGKMRSFYTPTSNSPTIHAYCFRFAATPASLLHRTGLNFIASLAQTVSTPEDKLELWQSTARSAVLPAIAELAQVCVSILYCARLRCLIQFLLCEGALSMATAWVLMNVISR